RAPPISPTISYARASRSATRTKPWPEPCGTRRTSAANLPTCRSRTCGAFPRGSQRTCSRFSLPKAPSQAAITRAGPLRHRGAQRPARGGPRWRAPDSRPLHNHRRCEQGVAMDAKKVAFIGLGVMGFPMAGHLARAGHAMTVYNRSAAKARQWTEKYGSATTARTPATAAADAQLVMLCVGNDDDVRAVALGPDGALAAMKPGAILVDHTTASAIVARELYAAA